MGSDESNIPPLEIFGWGGEVGGALMVSAGDLFKTNTCTVHLTNQRHQHHLTCPRVWGYFTLLRFNSMCSQF